MIKKDNFNYIYNFKYFLKNEKEFYKNHIKINILNYKKLPTKFIIK